MKTLKSLTIILTVTMLLFTWSASGQSTALGKYNMKEVSIQGALNDEYNNIGSSERIGDSPAEAIARYKNYLSKADVVVKKLEQNMARYIREEANIPESPDYKSNNADYKFYSKGVREEYERILSGIRLRNKRAEEGLAFEEAEKQKKAQESSAEQSKKVSTENENNTGTSKRQDNFWSDSGKDEDNHTTSTAGNHSDFVSSNKFQGNLSTLKEGEYFKNDKGEYFQKVANGAKKVDQYTYDSKMAADITAGFEKRAAERKYMEQMTSNAIKTTFSSFYSMNAAGQNLKNASQLEGNFDNVEDLNRAFSAQLSEVTRAAEEFKASKIQGAQAIATANASSSSSYNAYGEALGAFAGIVGGIAADREEKKAREELRAQRDAQERAIKARELQALTNVRNEVGKMFPEGGMPLSNHKLDEPVLYLFAYSSNKNDWTKDMTVPIKISNVIPVYRYTDGTYPYLSNVKRTFENGGITAPVIVGYFTNRQMAEKYQQSLIGIADQARFTVQLANIKVKEKELPGKDADKTDFWGDESKKEKGVKKNQQKENDFWSN